MSREDRQKRMKPADRSELVRLFNEGHGIKQIAERIGFSKDTVRTYLDGRGLKPIKSPLSTEESAKVADWYARGVDCEAICRRFGITDPTMYKHVKRNGVALRRKYRG